MAANLVRAGYQTLGFDPNPAVRALSESQGVQFAASAVTAVAEADVIITMLPSGPVMLAVWTEILPHVPTSALIIDCSTVDIDSCRAAHALAEAAGITALDA